MAVLIEAISVVIRAEAFEAHYPGGWDAFEAHPPNGTLCADGSLVRVSFMHPHDVRAFVEELEAYGFTCLRDGDAEDLVVVDQLRGPLAPCPWIEFGHLDVPHGSGNRVAACQLAGEVGGTLYHPDWWQYEGSLSQTFTFVPTDEVEKSMRFLRRENGVDVYLNEVTGEEVFAGRTSGG